MNQATPSFIICNCLPNNAMDPEFFMKVSIKINQESTHPIGCNGYFIFEDIKLKKKVIKNNLKLDFIFKYNITFNWNVMLSLKWM